jgi:hypothetical protein
MDWAKIGRLYHKRIWSPCLAAIVHQAAVYERQASPQEADESTKVLNDTVSCPGGLAQWPSRPPPERKIPGSNPARVYIRCKGLYMYIAGL